MRFTRQLVASVSLHPENTGLPTPEGLERSRKARWRHGFYSAEAREQRRRAMQEARLLRALLQDLW